MKHLKKHLKTAGLWILSFFTVAFLYVFEFAMLLGDTMNGGKLGCYDCNLPLSDLPKVAAHSHQVVLSMFGFGAIAAAATIASRDWKGFARIKWRAPIALSLAGAAAIALGAWIGSQAPAP